MASASRDEDVVRFAQFDEAHCCVRDLGRDFELHQRAADDLRHRGMILLHARAFIAAGDATDGKRALGRGINLPGLRRAGALHQHTTLQGLGVADGGNSHVHPPSHSSERRDVRRDDDRRDVLGGERSGGTLMPKR